MMDRRSVLLSGLAWTVGAGALSQQAGCAKEAKRDLTLGMVLEPPGLDPTAGAASAIGEITLYNIYETLTKIQSDGSVQPLLAEKWETADQKTWTFHLRKDAKFHNGDEVTAEDVAFTFSPQYMFGNTQPMVAPKVETRAPRAMKLEPPIIVLSM